MNKTERGATCVLSYRTIPSTLVCMHFKHISPEDPHTIPARCHENIMEANVNLLLATDWQAHWWTNQSHVLLIRWWRWCWQFYRRWYDGFCDSVTLGSLVGFWPIIWKSKICLFRQLSCHTYAPHPAPSGIAASFSLVCHSIVLLFYCIHAHVNTLKLVHKSWLFVCYVQLWLYVFICPNFKQAFSFLH